MKVLIACEFSGIVRESFRKRGHEALSCDLLSSEIDGPHYQGNVLDIIDSGWDLMIAHPPCTYLCTSGLHWNKKRPERVAKTEEGLEFVRTLMRANIGMIAIENPIGCIASRIRKSDQIVQPWQFGHPEAKATCLWLKNLPLLKPTNILQKPLSGKWNNQTGDNQQNRLGETKNRWKERSRTYVGIAEAMAEQWSIL